MDSNSFTPSGQGLPNNMTPQPNPVPTPPPAPQPTPQPISQPTPQPIPQPTPAPTPAPQPIPTPQPAPQPAPQPISTPAPEPIQPVEPVPPTEPLPPQEPAPTPTPETPEPPKKSNTKLLIIICACVGVLAFVVVILFAIPFGDNGTLWNTITSSNSQGGSGGTGNNARKTGDTVATGDYTYTANLDLEYEPKGSFHDGLMKAVSKDGDIVYLDTSGNVAFTLDLSYDPEGVFSDGLLPVQCNANRTKTKPSIRSESYNNTIRGIDEVITYGYIDKTGNLAIPCNYHDVNSFTNGYAAVVALQDKDLPNSYSIIDSNGQTVVPSGKYSNIVYEDNTFKDGVFKSAYYTNPDTNEYGWGCFNLNGEQLQTFADYNGTCTTDAENETIKANIQAKFGSDNYKVITPSEGLIAVTQKEPLAMFFVDTDGNTVWTIDIDKVIDADDNQYTEGLIPIFMWVGEGERPSIETMFERGLSEDEIYNNGGVVYYDHSGQPVFIFRYSKLLENSDDE